MQAGPLVSIAHVRVGTAGWSLPRASSAHFDSEGSHLERYARVLDGAEINSTFYRSHRRATYERWARSVPARFAFSVKLPKTITHLARLVGVEPLLASFLDETNALGHARTCVLVQLPPSLAFDAPLAHTFFAILRRRYEGDVACEPRHATWFGNEAAALMREHRIARVAADPAVVAGAAQPGGYGGVAYWRLHGSPRMYYSRYSEAALDDLARRISAARGAKALWCIFDNTTSGAATENALMLRSRLP